MSDTPRTDEVWKLYCYIEPYHSKGTPSLALRAHAEELERELAEMKVRASQALDEAVDARHERDQWREVAEEMDK